MKSLALLIGVFIITVAIVGIIAPYDLVTIGRHAVTPVGLYVVAILRIGIGLVFISVSRASRAPKTLRVVGAIVLVAGLTTPLFGSDRASVVLNWVSAQAPVFIRLGAGVVFAFGSFIMYAVTAAPALSNSARSRRGDPPSIK